MATIDDRLTREQQSELMANALAEAGVPPVKITKCVQAVMATLASTAIEDTINAMVDKRVNAMKSDINNIVEARVSHAVERIFTTATMQELVAAEAGRVAKGLYKFMFEHGEKP